MIATIWRSQRSAAGEATVFVWTCTSGHMSDDERATHPIARIMVELRHDAVVGCLLDTVVGLIKYQEVDVPHLQQTTHDHQICLPGSWEGIQEYDASNLDQ